MKSFLRHLLVSISYRFQKTVFESDASFGDFQIGQGVRSPIEILHHMNEVLEFARAKIIKRPRRIVPIMNWGEEIDYFIELLKEIDSMFEEIDFDINVAERLLQGPLCDVLTHVGQIAMLRRLNKAPIKGESFYDADIRKGFFEY